MGTRGDCILGVDLLQLVAASIDLDAGCLRIRIYKIPLESRDVTVLAVRMSSDKEGKTCSESEELITPSEEYVTPDHSINYLMNIESGSAWHAEVHLTETTLLPPLAAKIVRGKIIGRNSLTIVLQEVMYEPVCSMVPVIFAPRSASTVEKEKQDPGSPASRLKVLIESVPSEKW